MRAMLVYPKDIAENYFAKRPVMGIAYVGTMLEKAGHDVLLVDMRLKGYTVKYFKKLLHEFKPDVVGFSLVALSLDQAYELMKIVKEESGAIVVAGGPEVTLLPTKFLSKSFIDYAFMGEGEHSFLEFVNMYEKGESFYNIPGLCYRNEDGTPRVNPPKPIQDLDALPFPNWELFPLKKYKRRLSKIKFPIASSRGCPYTCKFCDSVKVNAAYRVRSPNNVVDELEQVHNKYKNKNFQFMDDNIAIYKNRVIDMCDEIIRRGLHKKITWVVGQGFSPSKGSYDLFKKMHDAGCIVLYFGIESADDEVLRAIRKPHTVAQVRNAVRDAKRAGLIIKAPFMSGLPKATYEKEKKYIEFFKEMEIDMPKMGHLVPFPGTEMYDWVRQNAKPLTDLESMHEEISQTRGVLDTDMFKPGFETEEYPIEQRIKMLKEFQIESEQYVLKKLFGRPFGYVAFKLSRIKFIREMGVRFLDMYYDQF